MNKISEKIFKNHMPDHGKLSEFGFVKTNDGFKYTTEIMNDRFCLNVLITDTDIKTEVIDIATGDPYTLFLVDGACGGFVGAVRSAYEEVLSKIVADCFYKQVFKSDQAQSLISYVSNTYGDEPEYLWEKFPENAIWRRKDNKKWYGLLLTVSRDKLGLRQEGIADVIDLRAEPEYIDACVDGKTVFRGYHMNKKHWIAIILDGTVPLQDIERLLDKSYGLARKDR